MRTVFYVTIALPGGTLTGQVYPRKMLKLLTHGYATINLLMLLIMIVIEMIMVMAMAAHLVMKTIVMLMTPWYVMLILAASVHIPAFQWVHGWCSNHEITKSFYLECNICNEA